MLQGKLKDNKWLPLVLGLASGLYPVIFYYSNNYSLINTWKHLGFFICLFLFVPVAFFFVLRRILRIQSFTRLRRYALAFFSLLFFLFFIELSLYAKVHVWFTVGIVVVSLAFAYFLSSHLKKVVVFQLLLAVIGMFSLVPTLVKQLNYSDAWMQQPDDIESVKFKKTPNIYYLQPDGYVNFSEMKRGYYEINNNPFKNFLEENGFTLYDDFRSNYNATLASNMATFGMKHHYLNYGFNLAETINGREVIISGNPVLNILKNNGYKTHFIAEVPYLLANKPEMGYDYSNFTEEDVSFIGTGYNSEKEIFEPLESTIVLDTLQPKFYFVEIFKPGHVPSRKEKSLGARKEKELWIERLEIANATLKKAIEIIKTNDPDALIMIMADHGGDVGMSYTLQSRRKSLERDWIYSIYSAQLAIHWPGGEAPHFDSKLETPVNVFRILFSYLAENESYLNNLQENSSYIIIEENAPKGVYKCIDEDGKVTFDKV